MTTFGIQLRSDPSMTESVQFSRSPSRAMRRQQRGYRQHWVTRPMRRVVVFQGVMIGHPDTLAAVARIVGGLGV